MKIYRDALEGLNYITTLNKEFDPIESSPYTKGH